MKDNFLKIKKRSFLLIILGLLVVILLALFLITREEGKRYPLVNNSVEMPNLVGQTTDNAIKIAESKGLKLNVSKAKSTNNQVEKSIVISQNPAIGELIEFNSFATVYVNEED